MSDVERVSGYFFSAHIALLLYLLLSGHMDLLLIIYAYGLGLLTVLLLATIPQTYGKYFPLLFISCVSTFMLSLKIPLADLLSWAPLIAMILGALIGAETDENFDTKNGIRAIAGLTIFFLILHVLVLF